MLLPNIMRKIYPASALLISIILALTWFILYVHHEQQSTNFIANPNQPLSNRLQLLKNFRSGSKAQKIWQVSLNDTTPNEHRHAFITLATHERIVAAAPALDALLLSSTTPVADRLLAIESLARIAKQETFQGLFKTLEHPNEQLRLAAAEALIRTGQHEPGFTMLFRLARLETTRSFASMRLQRLTGQSFPLNPNSGPAKAFMEVKAWEDWWLTHKVNFQPMPYQSE